MKYKGIGLMILAVAGLTSCTSSNVAPLTQETVVNINGAAIPGLRLLQANGVSYAGTYRAAHGVVVCGHFDINTLEKAGIAAAMAKNWKTNGLVGELDAPIVKVNRLAAAKGVELGMKVRDALALLNQE